MRRRAQGAEPLEGGRCSFRTWAPQARNLSVVLASGRSVELAGDDNGYFGAVVDGVRPGSTYRYVIDGGEPLPDPASRAQPGGVHGPSAVVDSSSFPWTDDGWAGMPLQDYIIMEAHVGTFTPEGTFDAMIAHLDDMHDLGITALEVMPIAQFPGARNWGYDGVFPYAAQNTYGGPEGLMRLVDACHARGIAFILDVVYNHLGPEGNRLGDFGPYFTELYRTPWGAAMNVDGPYSDEVRRFFIDNALMWLEDFHVDALRLDAVHGIFDMSAYPFLRQLGDVVHERARDAGRPFHLIAESDSSDPRIVTPSEDNGIGMD
ncbi:MAG TPA: alpha-amylase family glycosyl hydrolase, partial [Actinomycetota bacterium]|nr:alpha-amylase family glycosyl hydrolase [Actinomycetota bacterium]